MTAQAATGCTVARGESRLIVAGIGRYDTTVGLSRLAMPNCQTMVVLVLSGVSAEVRRLAVDTMLSGAAAGTHADYPQRRSRSSCPWGCRDRPVLGHCGRRGMQELRVQPRSRHATDHVPRALGSAHPASPLSPLQCPPRRACAGGALRAHRDLAGQRTLRRSDRRAGRRCHGGNRGQRRARDPRTGITTAAGGCKSLWPYRNAAQPRTGSRPHPRHRGYNGDWQSEAEIYDPQTGTARVIGSLRSAVFGHTATTLADGRVVVIGGHNGSGVYRTVDIFDPDSGTWMPSDDAPASEYQHSATLLADGRILVAGGRLQSSAVVASSAVFDPRAARGQMWLPPAI